jgi:hypothetical protein
MCVLLCACPPGLWTLRTAVVCVASIMCNVISHFKTLLGWGSVDCRHAVRFGKRAAPAPRHADRGLGWLSFCHWAFDPDARHLWALGYGSGFGLGPYAHTFPPPPPLFFCVCVRAAHQLGLFLRWTPTSANAPAPTTKADIRHAPTHSQAPAASASRTSKPKPCVELASKL